ncbi:hypothetical protein F5890DRAFT_1550152 [Lentinula detonsa]|uniref:Uncharacterized protein n=1 Tax=Lentinula detonsa TaxID=2804962 RepID=A0AA38UXU0_9AGAR|nr:hypothetical protein F5890DRAFT_1550152 [Lentinula detonsa]
MDGDNLSESSYQATAYLRIASVSIALYDFLETAPSTWRYTREQWNAPRMTVSFTLFLLIQLGLSISTFFNELMDPFLKSYNQRYLKPSWVFAAAALEGLTNLYHRTVCESPSFFLCFIPLNPDSKFIKGNCRGVFQIEHLGAWIYYVVAIIYDLATSTICMIYLYKYKAASNSFFAKVTRMMFYDGVGYFTALTCVNILNLVIYRASQEIQTAAASLGYCVTWIMSKRLIIHLHEVSMKRRIDTVANAATSSSQSTSSEFSSSHEIRTHVKARSPTASLDLTIPDFDMEDMEAGLDWVEDGNVSHVRSEKTVQVERRPRAVYELGDDSGCLRV